MEPRGLRNGLCPFALQHLSRVPVLEQTSKTRFQEMRPTGGTLAISSPVLWDRYPISQTVMFDEFIFDLKVARKRSGLTQVDCGHLLSASDNIVSQIERGQRLPTLRELCSLSLIYGRSFECLYAELFRQVRKDLMEQLGNMPDAPKDWLATKSRQRSLERLARRLLEETDLRHGS